MRMINTNPQYTHTYIYIDVFSHVYMYVYIDIHIAPFESHRLKARGAPRGRGSRIRGLFQRSGAARIRLGVASGDTA